ncbi:MAG: oligopeptide ABC transporter permease OppB [Chlamydiales bacterium]
MSFFIQKFASFIITFFAIISFTFFLMKMIPGDPFEDDQGMTEEIHQSLLRHYGLDQPIYIQYQQYIMRILTWDFGPSFKYKDRSVNDIIKEAFPVSLTLGIEALALSLSIGITLGTFAASKWNQWQDRAVMTFIVFGISVPSFIVATLLQYSLALKLGWFPVARWETWSHTFLPAFALALMPIAFITRLTRASMIEVLNQKYILAAKARGISTTTIIIKHALRNALLPVAAYLSQLTTKVLIGSFVIEKIFGIPGVGQWLINAIYNRDYTIIMGITVFYSIILLIVTFSVDILFGVLDPRIRFRTKVVA